MSYAVRQLYISTLHVSLKIGCRARIPQRLSVTATAPLGESRIILKALFPNSSRPFAAF